VVLGDEDAVMFDAGTADASGEWGGGVSGRDNHSSMLLDGVFDQSTALDGVDDVSARAACVRATPPPPTSPPIAALFVYCVCIGAHALAIISTAGPHWCAVPTAGPIVGLTSRACSTPSTACAHLSLLR
jgi:hypothetical protein